MYLCTMCINLQRCVAKIKINEKSLGLANQYDRKLPSHRANIEFISLDNEHTKGSIYRNTNGVNIKSLCMVLKEG